MASSWASVSHWADALGLPEKSTHLFSQFTSLGLVVTTWTANWVVGFVTGFSPSVFAKLRVEGEGEEGTGSLGTSARVWVVWLLQAEPVFPRASLALTLYL